MQAWVAREYERVEGELTAPTYRGPQPESLELVRAFLSETIRHSTRVAMLTQALTQDFRPMGHDLKELVPAATARARIDELTRSGKLSPEDAAWLTAYAEGSASKPWHREAGQLDVSKRLAQVAAGLATTGRPNQGSLLLHQLSGHHAMPTTRAQMIEVAGDVLDALVVPRTYTPGGQGRSYEAAKELFWSNVQTGRTPFPDTPESRGVVDEVIEAHRRLSETVWR